MADLYLAFTQSVIDRVLNDTAFPLNIINEWRTFVPPPARQNAATIVIPPIQCKAALESPSALSLPAGEDGSPSFAKQLELNRDSLLLRLADIDNSRKLANESGGAWTGPSQEETADLRKLKFDGRAHLAHLRIDIDRRPQIKLSGARTTIQGVVVSVDVVGELWVRRPKLECVRECEAFGKTFCCGWDWVWVWEKWGTASLGDVRFTIEAQLQAEVDHNRLIVTGEIGRLRLDYDILKELPLEVFANLALGTRRIELVDFRNLVAALPYIDRRYGIREARLSGNGELRVDVELERR